MCLHFAGILLVASFLPTMMTVQLESLMRFISSYFFGLDTKSQYISFFLITWFIVGVIHVSFSKDVEKNNFQVYSTSH